MFEKEIKELYEKIPPSVCGKDCAKCCTNIIQFTASEEKMMGGYEWDGQCSHLIDGRGAYAVRRLHTGKISFRKGDGGDHTYLRPIQESGGGTHGKRRIKLRREVSGFRDRRRIAGQKSADRADGKIASERARRVPHRRISDAYSSFG